MDPRALLSLLGPSVDWTCRKMVSPWGFLAETPLQPPAPTSGCAVVTLTHPHTSSLPPPAQPPGPAPRPSPGRVDAEGKSSCAEGLQAPPKNHHKEGF